MIQGQLTPKQRHILANLSDVKAHRPRVPVNPRVGVTRHVKYLLDGVWCTEQVTSLLVRDFVSLEIGGGLCSTAKARHLLSVTTNGAGLPQ